MRKHRRLLIMALGLSPFVALACYFIYLSWVLPGAILFVGAITFGNWFTWKTELWRTSDKAEKR